MSETKPPYPDRPFEAGETVYIKWNNSEGVIQGMDGRDYIVRQEYDEEGDGIRMPGVFLSRTPWTAATPSVKPDLDFKKGDKVYWRYGDQEEPSTIQYWHAEPDIWMTESALGWFQTAPADELSKTPWVNDKRSAPTPPADDLRAQLEAANNTIAIYEEYIDNQRSLEPGHLNGSSTCTDCHLYETGSGWAHQSNCAKIAAFQEIERRKKTT